MLEYNEIRERKYIIYEDEPYEVLSSHVFRKQQRKPVNQTKLKSLISGRVIEVSFHSTEKVNEADISSKKMKFLYSAKGEYWFSEESNPSNRFSLSVDMIGSASKFMKDNTIVDVNIFTDNDDNEKIIGIRLPIKTELKVTEAPPSIKGNTSAGGNKQITLETGAVINAPLFVNEGDIVRVNTETGEYVERVS
jgi:elongation factor P